VSGTYHLWLLVHSHERGTDFTAFESEALAHHHCAVIAVRESRHWGSMYGIQAHFEAGRDDLAVREFLTHSPGTGLHIHRLAVVNGVMGNLSIVETDTDLVHIARSMPRGNVGVGYTFCDQPWYWPNAHLDESCMTIPRFTGWLPKDPRVVNCLGCAAVANADGHA
jgi:hypothetical protein